MKLLRACLGGCALILSFAPGASANQLQLALSGAVSSSNLQVIHTGQAVTVSFIYETTTPFQFTANQQAFFINPFSSVSVATSGYNSSFSTGTFGQIDKGDKTAGQGNTDSIGFVFAANPASYTFTNPKGRAVPLGSIHSGVDQTFAALSVQLESLNTSLWSDFLLPTTYTFSDFSFNHSMTIGFSGGGFSTAFTSLTVTDLTIAPEPGSGIMIAIALLLATAGSGHVRRRLALR